MAMLVPGPMRITLHVLDFFWLLHGGEDGHNAYQDFVDESKLRGAQFVGTG